MSSLRLTPNDFIPPVRLANPKCVKCKEWMENKDEQKHQRGWFNPVFHCWHENVPPFSKERLSIPVLKRSER